MYIPKALKIWRDATDLTKAKKLIGYNPKTKLDDTIKKIIEYERQKK